jgi:glycerophosphoryl diester phosphodiesterase
MTQPINIAHRGFSGEYPENTILAFQKALELGVDAIELDVHLSSDGEVMVFHDEDLERTTGETGFIKDYSYARLCKLDASGSYKGKFGRNQIPTLSEYMDLIQDEDIITFLELKNSLIVYPTLEEKVAECIYKYRQEKKTIIFSANHPSVKYFGQIAPDVRLLFPFDNWIFGYGAYCKEHGISLCMPYFRALTSDVIAEIKDHGITIYPWIIDEEDDMQNMIKLGVDGILTNRPDLLKKILEN